MRFDGRRSAYLAFGLNAVFAGGSAIGIRYSNRELDPLWGAALRFLLAAVLLVAVMAALRLALPRGRALLGAVLFGTLHFGAAMALAYYGLVRVSAGAGQTLMSLVPLATLLLAVVERQERMRLAAVVGAILALAGVASLSQASVRDGVPLVSLLALVGSACCLAQAALLVNRFPQLHPVTLNAVGMVAGSVLLLGGSLLAGESFAIPQRSETWLALGYMSIFSSALAFVLYIFLLGRWPASRVAYTFVVSPVVTVVLSALIMDEALHTGLILGGALILGGVYVGALRPARLAAAVPLEAGRGT